MRLQALITREGGNFRLAPWDWRYYAEKLRQEKYDFDAEQLKPYFQLSNLIEAAFFTAEKLFGLSFRERHDIPVYHPDVRVWEVAREGAGDRAVLWRLFRPARQAGRRLDVQLPRPAQAGRRRRSAHHHQQLPISAKADPCLLSFDDARDPVP